MDATQLEVSCCQRCRYFTLAGRRGGHCGQLNVSVRGSWAPCPLADPVFTEPIDVITQPQVAIWPQGIVLNHAGLEHLASEFAQERV